MMAGGLGTGGGHGARTEGGAVIKRVLSGVETSGGLGAYGSWGPEGGGQITHLQRNLQRSVDSLAARRLLIESHSKQFLQLLVTILPHMDNHLLIRMGSL